MASTVTKRRGRTSKQDQPQKRESALRVSRDEMKAMIKEAVLEALAEHDQDAWDRQIEADVNAGRMDALLEQVQEDIRQSKTEPLAFEKGKLK